MNIYTFRYYHNQTGKAVFLTFFSTQFKEAIRKAKASTLIKHNFTFDGLESVEELCP